MVQLMWSVLYGALAVLAVGILILVHEFGHFVVAKAVGVRVEVFSIGFWKKIIGFRKGDTEYRISVIPLGGYVKMAGEHPDEAEGKPDEFYSKSPGQRALVFVAGVFFNMILALVGFAVAFSMGVPFTVAEVGSVQKGWPAWEHGLRRGDEVVRVNDIEDPDFNDVTQEVALGGEDIIDLELQRGDQRLEKSIKPRYSKEMGFRWLGFRPPSTLMVTGLSQVGSDGPWPAREAGIELGDKVLAINGQQVSTAEELSTALRDSSDDSVKLRISRDGKELTKTVQTATYPHYGVGISCLSTTIEEVGKGRMWDEIGGQPGDKITAVNGKPVRSVVGLEETIAHSLGEVEFTVQRNGETTTLEANIPDKGTLHRFLFSFEASSSTVLQWVREDSPAWEAGMRRGDEVVSVAGQSVESWQEILEQGAGRETREMKWRHDGELVTATLTPVQHEFLPEPRLGILFGQSKTGVKQYGIVRAMKTGIMKTYGTLASIVLTFRGFAEQKVSPKTLGGVVTIAYSSYLAAQQGLPKLLYLMAFISISLAFLNILPIPVLDGGHLLFVAIEKIRGKPVPETVMAVAQYVGLVLLLMLVIYVTKNDIVRMIEFQ